MERLGVELRTALREAVGPSSSSVPRVSWDAFTLGPRPVLGGDKGEGIGPIRLLRLVGSSPCLFPGKQSCNEEESTVEPVADMQLPGAWRGCPSLGGCSVSLRGALHKSKAFLWGGTGCYACVFSRETEISNKCQLFAWLDLGVNLDDECIHLKKCKN